MTKQSIIHQDNYIVYNILKSKKKSRPTVIFLHGLMSDMTGIKASYLADYCQKHDYNFIRFDNFGHGLSSGVFLQQTIGSWLKGLKLVLDHLTNKPAIIIGSSMGGWIALLSALHFPKQVKAIIGISAAPDFTEESIWQKLSVNDQQKIKEIGVLGVSGAECHGDTFPISYQLIMEAKEHLLLNRTSLAINCPIHLIHGIKDMEVDFSVSLRLLEKIDSKKVVLKLVKDGDHKLSRPQDLQLITNSLEEIINA